jgi:hypothetical protein
VEVVERMSSGLLVARKRLSRAIYPDEFMPVRPWYEMRDRILGPDGRVIEDWSEPTRNALADEGESVFLNSMHRGVAVPTQYLCLLNAAGTVDTTTMATMVESEVPGTNGYARQQLAVGTVDWPNAPALNSGDMQITALAKTFQNTSGAVTWTVTHVGLVTVLTGTAGLFLMYVAPIANRNIGPGMSYQVTLSSKMQ